jgi:hypothetical protein
MSQKWVVETPGNGYADELCIGRVAFEQDDDDEGFKRLKLNPVIIWLPNFDDEESVGGNHFMVRENVPEYGTISFNVDCIEMVESERSLYRVAIEAIFNYR